jgi:hypothetical protein
MVELHRLVLDTGDHSPLAGLPVDQLEVAPHGLPVDPPGRPEERFQPLLEACRPDDRERGAGDEGAVEDVAGQAQGVVAVEVGQENDVDRSRVDAEPMQVRQQRRAAIEQEMPVDNDPGVVTLERERRSRSQEGEPQAIVTPGFR